MPVILKSNRYYSGPSLSSTANVLQSPQFSAFSEINPDICKHINLLEDKPPRWAPPFHLGSCHQALGACGVGRAGGDGSCLPQRTLF